jgi:hypothetical protein
MIPPGEKILRNRRAAMREKGLGNREGLPWESGLAGQRIVDQLFDRGLPTAKRTSGIPLQFHNLEG